MKRHALEEIVSKLRQVDVMAARGQALATALKKIGVTEQRNIGGRAAYLAIPSCVEALPFSPAERTSRTWTAHGAKCRPWLKGWGAFGFQTRLGSVSHWITALTRNSPSLSGSSSISSTSKAAIA
jgi:hypothetical protein